MSNAIESVDIGKRVNKECGKVNIFPFDNAHPTKPV
jgi:hypothetical protein